ncbi:MAG: hypothetical protein KJ787_02555 [Gammaproteobacteria bacterium]|nr:hypothetical protein [Gammaproteobacteria bacterium]
MTGYSTTTAHDQAPPPSRHAAAVERIPHIIGKICMLWGSRELDAFFSHLLMDSRDGSRHGLPVEVANEILFLMQTNKLVRAFQLMRGSTLPLAEAYRLVDSGDQARLGGDAFSDPLVSHDTIERQSRRGGAHVEPAAAANGSQLAGLGELIMMFVRSRWVLGAIFIILSSKFVWPVIRPLI